MKIWKLAAGLIFSIASCLGHAAEPIKIAVTGPFSGSSSPMGLSMLAGVRLAIEEMNLGGGLFGRSLFLVERDDKADPETGKQVVDQARKSGRRAWLRQYGGSLGGTKVLSGSSYSGDQQCRYRWSHYKSIPATEVPGQLHFSQFGK